MTISNMDLDQVTLNLRESLEEYIDPFIDKVHFIYKTSPNKYWRGSPTRKEIKDHILSRIKKVTFYESCPGAGGTEVTSWSSVNGIKIGFKIDETGGITSILEFHISYINTVRPW